MREKENVILNLDPDTRLLRDDELEAVSGGGASFHDFHFTQKIDKASPVLL